MSGFLFLSFFDWIVGLALLDVVLLIAVVAAAVIASLALWFRRRRRIRGQDTAERDAA